MVEFTYKIIPAWQCCTKIMQSCYEKDDKGLLTNLLIDNNVDKAGLSSWLAFGIIIIGVIIRENNKLQNFDHVNVANIA